MSAFRCFFSSSFIIVSKFVFTQCRDSVHCFISSHVGLNSWLHQDLDLCLQVVESLREWKFIGCLHSFLSRRFSFHWLHGLYLRLCRYHIAALRSAAHLLLDLSTYVNTAAWCHLNTVLRHLWHLHLRAIFIIFVLLYLHAAHLELLNRSHIDLGHVMCLVARIDVLRDILRLLHDEAGPLGILHRIFECTRWFLYTVHQKRLAYNCILFLMQVGSKWRLLNLNRTPSHDFMLTTVR